jgi:hypothetical protein
MADVIDLKSRDRIVNAISDSRVAAHYRMGWDDGVKYGRRLANESVLAGIAVGVFIGLLIAGWLR